MNYFNFIISNKYFDWVSKMVCIRLKTLNWLKTIQFSEFSKEKDISRQQKFEIVSQNSEVFYKSFIKFFIVFFN